MMVIFGQKTSGKSALLDSPLIIETQLYLDLDRELRNAIEVGDIKLVFARIKQLECRWRRSNRQ